ncbi:DUF6207 family protein [Streptomyces sp. NBC_00444]|uniref:DUF6207 family protein n=1 Tax=Streptomyces sp. NBC_00444 TaxID=2975744 RepID=UPI002E2445C7
MLADRWATATAQTTRDAGQPGVRLRCRPRRGRGEPRCGEPFAPSLATYLQAEEVSGWCGPGRAVTRRCCVR